MTTVTNDGLLAAAEILGLRSLPVVLAVSPRQETVSAFREARRVAMAELSATGSIDANGDVTDDLATALIILSRPDRQLVARIVAAQGVRRVCVARRGAAHVLAVRDSDGIEVSTVWADERPAMLAGLLRRALPSCPPAEVVAFSAPSALLHERLDAALRSADFADVAYGFGVAERDAVEFGMAMATCRTHAEITAYRHDEGIATRSAAAAGVYDTDRGRIIAGPSLTADAEVWSTFAPGSDHRLAQAISGVIGSLPGGEWMS